MTPPVSSPNVVRLIGLEHPSDIHRGVFRLTLQVGPDFGNLTVHRFDVPASILHLMGSWIVEVYADGFEGDDITQVAP